MWKFLRGGATVIPGATFIPESRVINNYVDDNDNSHGLSGIWIYILQSLPLYIYYFIHHYFLGIDQILWEGHKNLAYIPLTIWQYLKVRHSNLESKLWCPQFSQKTNVWIIKVGQIFVAFSEYPNIATIFVATINWKIYSPCAHCTYCEVFF